MMTWNHRVMREGGLYTIHEVFYHKNGTIRTWTTEPVSPDGESLKELGQSLDWFKEALSKPVLDYETGKPIKEKP